MVAEDKVVTKTIVFEGSCVGCQFADWDHESFLKYIDDDLDPLQMLSVSYYFDSKNKYDSKAIALTWDGTRCGYVPKDQQDSWRDFVTMFMDYHDLHGSGFAIFEEWVTCQLKDRKGHHSVKLDTHGKPSWFTFDVSVVMSAPRSFFLAYGC